MRVEYSDDGYKKSGSLLTEGRKLWRLRSMPNLLELGRSHSRNLKQTVRRIRNSEDTLSFESELFKKFHEFMCGEYRGDISLSYSITIYDDSIVGQTSATFIEEDGDFQIDVSTEYENEQELREFGRDILLLLLQYNLQVNSFYGKTEHQSDRVRIEGQGDLTVPVKLRPSSENDHLVTDFPVSKPTALRFIPF